MNSCTKASNNKYTDCPPRMDDGRHFTDYRPRCVVNSELQKESKAVSSHAYRMYLIDNASNLMQKCRQRAYHNNRCGPCQDGSYTGANHAPSEASSRNASGCKGAAKESNCCADTGSLFNYYGHADTKAQGEIIPRVAMPSGGTPLTGGDPVAYNA